MVPHYKSESVISSITDLLQKIQMLLGKEKRPILTVPFGRCLEVDSSRVLCISDIMKDPGPFFHSILLPSKAGFLFSSSWSYDQHSNPNGALNGTWIKSVSYRVK